MAPPQKLAPGAIFRGYNMAYLIFTFLFHIVTLLQHLSSLLQGFLHKAQSCRPFLPSWVPVHGHLVYPPICRIMFQSRQLHKIISIRKLLIFVCPFGGHFFKLPAIPNFVPFGRKTEVQAEAW